LRNPREPASLWWSVHQKAQKHMVMDCLKKSEATIEKDLGYRTWKVVWRNKCDSACDHTPQQEYLDKADLKFARLLFMILVGTGANKVTDYKKRKFGTSLW
jgi:hypothetical protein